MKRHGVERSGMSAHGSGVAGVVLVSEANHNHNHNPGVSGRDRRSERSGDVGNVSERSRRALARPHRMSRRWRRTTEGLRVSEANDMPERVRATKEPAME